ncbi:hypothetical protein ASF27_01625 [Methylobacterium sp. Leaf102]|uniref:hypothetical protein n=1 Tax=Methylobacterium sp. Leaf102 TaxID=1736253 RepID=UPI0006FD4E87|nr:hypothetical protein [Methylobacterium sp. Leaf102]KQP34288.1 hypothetical protein ASF27_01625 [Methylobacterium sp. Leaf102]
MDLKHEAPHALWAYRVDHAPGPFVFLTTAGQADEDADPVRHTLGLTPRQARDLARDLLRSVETSEVEGPAG